MPLLLLAAWRTGDRTLANKALPAWSLSSWGRLRLVLLNGYFPGRNIADVFGRRFFAAALESDPLISMQRVMCER